MRRPNKRYTGLDDKLKQLSWEQPECSIYKVHRHLRNLSPQSYEPQLIAIGPYHRRKKHLHIMEHHKLRYLHSLLHRNVEVEKALKYVDAIKEVASDARKCYSVDVNLSEIEFVDMLVLDGCFIIELVRKYVTPELRDEKDPIFQMSWIRNCLRRDLMLFENQVPFFVLSKLFNLIKIRDPDWPLISLLLNFFEDLYPGKPDTNFARDKSFAPNEMKHLLDLIHQRWTHRQNTSTVAKYKESGTTRQDSGSDSGSDLEKTFRFIKSASNLREANVEIEKDENTSTVAKYKESGTTGQDSGSDSGSDPEKTIFRFIKSASKLREANVEFEKDENLTLFDIEFEKGVMRMVPIIITYMTEALFRNLIAYEQCFNEDIPIPVTDYVRLMDCLIISSKDVEILSHCGIIDNWLGDDEVVAKMMNKLTDSVTIDEDQFRYLDIFENVNKHCESPWNRWMATLRRNYLNSPWAIVSIIAAIVLLLLTFTQTLFTIHPL